MTSIPSSGSCQQYSQSPKPMKNQQTLYNSQQVNVQVPKVNLVDFTQINQSGYFVNQTNLFGAGRYGQVYQGFSRKDQIIMAVKKIPQTTQNGTNIAIETKREIDILRQICSDHNYHKNVLRYYHYEDYEGFFYVFTQYCQKGSLKQYVAKKGNQISEKQYFRIFKSIVQGMIFINKKFIIHRDLKPANILVNQKQQIKIGDFGISRQIPFRDQSLTKNMCTPHYGAPEILRQQQFYTQNVDVWSCGVMMYELIEKKSIYEKLRPRTKNQLIKALKHFQQTQDFVQFSNPNVSEKFQIILKKMLTIKNNKRPAFEEIEKYIEYEQLVKFYHLYESPGVQTLTANNNTDSVLIGYNDHQKQKYFRILKKYVKFKKDKISILVSLHKKFMNKSFQVLWNVEKFILKYLTLNMYIIKAQQYSNWLHVSLNDNIINLQDEIKIKISQFRYNYRMIAQLLRQQKKKIDNDIRNYYKSILTQAQKIQLTYLGRQEQSQRIRSYLDLRILEELFTHTRKNTFAQFQSYHNIYKSLIQLRQYYLTYEHVQALPTYEDKQIYFYMLLIYHFDKFLSQRKYIKQLVNEEEMTGIQRKKQVRTNKTPIKDQGGFNFNTNPKSMQISITGSMAESVSDFRERLQDQKEMMKWIFRHNLSRKHVFRNTKKLLSGQKSNISVQNRLKDTNNKNDKMDKVQQDRVNSSKSLNSKNKNKSSYNQGQDLNQGKQMQVLPSQERRLVRE